IDFHGSTGYGQAFTDAISQHWGDRPLEDLQKGWAAAQRQYDYLDGANACALGASYGGYMVYWIAGNWHTPDSGAWKWLVAHGSAGRVPVRAGHGRLDYSIPVSQGIAASTAVKRKGIESKILYFPDEKHWVPKPDNSSL